MAVFLFISENEVRILKKIVGCSQMKAIDASTIQGKGVPSCVLMERAALAVVDEIEKRTVGNIRELLEQKCLGRKYSKEKYAEKVLVVCGSGNNGGDGIAIARILHLHGIKADIYLAGRVEKMTEETLMKYQIAKNYHVSFVNNIQWSEYTTIVDAIFGVGLAREIEGTYRELIEEMNRASAWKVAVDIPSGINGDTGRVLGVAFQADLTVTFAYTKYGLCLYPGRMYAGKVVTADIGIYIEEESIGDIETEYAADTGAELDGGKKVEGRRCSNSGDYAVYLEKSDIGRLPKRLPYGNKGTFGKVLIVAGSKGMCGAAYLAASAVMAGGAGMVKIVTAEENRIPLQASLPEAMISCEFTEEENRKNLDWCDVIVIGPGVGMSEEATEHVKWFLEHADLEGKRSYKEDSTGKKSHGKTVILDADGLNLLAKHPQWKEILPQDLIITPHLGEMSRLTEKSIFEIQENPVETAKNFAKEWNLVCVLKDACTVIADQVGNTYLNLSGNAGMATAGSGDVLAGIVAAVCCMYLPNKMLNVSDDSVKIPDVNSGFQAAMGVMLHGCSGDKAAEQKGMYSMTARDIIANVGTVLQRKEEKL